jgi:hypothetical protein
MTAEDQKGLGSLVDMFHALYEHRENGKPLAQFQDQIFRLARFVFRSELGERSRALTCGLVLDSQYIIICVGQLKLIIRASKSSIYARLKELGCAVVRGVAEQAMKCALEHYFEPISFKPLGAWSVRTNQIVLGIAVGSLVARSALLPMTPRCQGVLPQSYGPVRHIGQLDGIPEARPFRIAGLPTLSEFNEILADDSMPGDRNAVAQMPPPGKGEPMTRVRSGDTTDARQQGRAEPVTFRFALSDDSDDYRRSWPADSS